MLAEALIMLIRVAGIALALVCAGAARNNDSNKPAETRGENESVVITATLYAKPEAVKEVLGSDLGGHYIVVAVEVTPRFGKEVAINRDDFVLKTDKDGEKSGPFAPSQIAGRGAMVIRQTGGAGGTGMHDNDGPIWGGIRVPWGSHAGSAAMEWAAPARPKAPRPRRAPDPAKKTIPCWPC
jgi:hypothetical protein